MDFLYLLSVRAPNRFFFAVMLGALAGILYSLLIPMLMSAVTPPDPSFTLLNENARSILGVKVSNFSMAALFFGTCLGIIIVSSMSEIMLSRIGSDCARDIRTSIYRQIGTAPVEAIEKIGVSRLITSINIDVPRIIIGARAMPLIFVNLITLVGMLGFLVYLDNDVFNFVILAIAFGVVVYQLPISVGRAFFTKSREANDLAQESVRGLIFGAKELKLDEDKQTFYSNEILLKHEENLVNAEKSAFTITTATVNIGQLLSFFVIGSVTFVLTNYYPIDTTTLLGVVMVLLYVTGPIGIILNDLPGLAIAAVSYKKLKNLMAEIPAESAAISGGGEEKWQKLILSNVSYAYESNGEESGFKIGPVDLVFEPGSLSFIVGGNGSGKSTLSKLITLLYYPDTGAVYCDNDMVTDANINTLRKQVFAIFSDYFLFNRLLIDVSKDKEIEANGLLKKLRLDNKVKIVGGHFSTISLSDGQRKRLALLVAILEDRQLYLFDEWAADQDPEFRYLFYTDILSELKKKGKTVVVISHDDRYFDTADQLIIMEQGQISSVHSQNSKLAS